MPKLTKPQQWHPIRLTHEKRPIAEIRGDHFIGTELMINGTPLRISEPEVNGALLTNLNDGRANVVSWQKLINFVKINEY